MNVKIAHKCNPKEIEWEISEFSIPWTINTENTIVNILLFYDNFKLLKMEDLWIVILLICMKSMIIIMFLFCVSKLSFFLHKMILIETLNLSGNLVLLILSIWKYFHNLKLILRSLVSLLFILILFLLILILRLLRFIFM